ncbi:MAG TPA: hypothetical protein VK809_07465 [Bacteroidia bacterium]|jgi:hypothetical protein|nr:hypothetical protein [Bacteroidia bacterium]
MIRNRLYNQIREVLEKNPGFIKSDFQIETPSTQKTVLFITYKYNSKFQFEFQIPESAGEDGEYTFNGKISPGIVAVSEVFSVKGEAALLAGINMWVNCVWEELSTQPFLKSAKRIEERIDTVCTEFSSTDTKYFTSEEANSLKVHLDKLEKDLQIEIEEEIKDKKEAWQRIGTLSVEMGRLKTTLSSLTRPSWLNSFSRTTYDLIG